MVQEVDRPKFKEKLLILPLVISKGITNLPTLVVSILLIEIGISYNVTPALAGQLNAVSSMLAIFFALFMGILSVRYDHRNVLVWGLLLYAFSAAACSLANSFYILLPIFALTGIARAMVDPMLNSLIGIHVPAHDRTKAIGYTIGGLAFIYLIGSLSAAYLARIMDWHATMLIIVTPISATTLFLTLYLIPSIKKQSKDVSVRGLFSGFKEGLRNRSVLACLIGTVIGLSTWNVYLVYYATFLRQIFNISATSVSQIIIALSFGYISGSLLTSRFGKNFGIKITTVGTITILSLFTIFSMNVNDLIGAVGIGIIASFFAGMMITAITSLTLDQMPQFRGTVMSLQSAAVNFGSMLSTIIGGLLITSMSFGIYGVVMGCIGFLGAVIFYFFALEPT